MIHTEYVIIVLRQTPVVAGVELPGHCVIGPFPTEAAAKKYVVDGETPVPCYVTRILSPVDDPSDDIVLHP